MLKTALVTVVKLKLPALLLPKAARLEILNGQAAKSSSPLTDERSSRP